MTVKIICCARCYAKLSRYRPGRTVTQTRVWSYGADYGEFGDMYHQAYAKDLPLERVQSDVLIAYELNGAPLRAEHGFPARLVVPGFYGTNSVKWLTRIKVAKNTGDRGLYHAQLPCHGWSRNCSAALDRSRMVSGIHVCAPSLRKCLMTSATVANGLFDQLDPLLLQCATGRERRHGPQRAGKLFRVW